MKKDSKFNETLAEIAYSAGALNFSTEDSRATISLFIEWANEFERINKKTDWSNLDYMTEIENFISAKINAFTGNNRPKIDWTRINNDVNGNPRYVCHFLNFIKDKDSVDLVAQRKPFNDRLSKQYETAIKRAKKIGGRKYHTKSYGGGIVFQSYNIQDTERAIYELLDSIK